MGKYIKLFNTRALYEAFVKSDDYIEPHVSLCEDDNIVNYNLISPAFEMVDLGLPSGLKWAKCNIGAEKETDYGLYFKWGETEGKTSDEASYFQGSYVANDNFQDAATANMGAGYRMPTSVECDELVSGTDHSLVTIDGVLGMKYSKKGDADTYIFVPFAGRCSGGSFNNADKYGYFWTSTLRRTAEAWYLFCYANGTNRTETYRYNGFPVRGVSE